MSRNQLLQIKMNRKSSSSLCEAEAVAAEPEDSSEGYDLDETLDMIGFGRVQIEILFVFGFLLMMVVNETMGMSIITIASQCDFSTSSQQKAIMSAACVTGILLASYPWGYISDTYGRRTVLLRATIGALACSTISMFVSNLWVFIVLRFLTGLGTAGASATIYAYLGEFTSPKYRPSIINYASVFVGISTIYCPGFGKVNLEILLMSGVILMVVINETMGMSIITIASQCDFNTTSQEKAYMSAACFIGILVSSFPWGYISDNSGRRLVLLRATLSAVTFSFISMFVSNLWVFIVLRFLTGIGISGASATIYAYLGEYNTLKYRAVVINYASIFVGLSSVYAPAVAWLILPQTWSFSVFGIFYFRPWRLLILFNLLPGLIGAIWIWRLHETPKLYLSHGKDAEALKVLYWIYERNTGKPSKDFEVKQLIPESNKEFIQTLAAKKTTWEIATSMWKQTIPLFKRPHALNYSVCCFVMFGIFFLSSGMGLWYPEIQNRLGFGTVDTQRTICEVINQKPNNTLVDSDVLEMVCNDEVSEKTYIDSITLGASYVAAYLLLGFIIRPLGRKSVLAGSLFISGVCGLALQWVDHPTAIVVLFCGFLMMSGLCVSVLSGSVVDLIPTHLRGKAVCICLMLGRLGSVVGNNLVGAVLETYCEITFYIFSGLIILCSLLTLLLPI